MIRRLYGIIGGVVLLAALLVVGFWYANRWMVSAPDPETIAAASLDAVREQNRLVPFAARFVAVVTSEQHRFGLSAKKTLIMPGTVQYALDLAALRQDDLRWDGTTKTLSITLPPIIVETPKVELDAVREYDGGGLLLALTDTENLLDKANQAAAQKELVAQARQPLPMKLAREAAISAMERSFSMPLRAAGIEATVVAGFAKE